MQVFLVYDNANELQEVHALEAVAETRARHFGGTFEGRDVWPVPAYTSDELQKFIDDLDAAHAYVPARLEDSLKIASAILMLFPEEALRAYAESQGFPTPASGAQTK
jgi:hypothetical protein